MIGALRVIAVVVFAAFAAVLPASARSVAGQASSNVAVIPGFHAPLYPGFKGVPAFPSAAAEVSRYRFTELPAGNVTEGALQPYDTIILYGLRWATLSSRAQSAINAFAQTGKVLIWDADATGSQNYSTFVHPFSTTAAGEVGDERSNGSAVSFVGGGDALASPNSNDPAYLDPAVLIASSHLVEDMTVMRPGPADWAPSLVAANETLPTGGWLLASGYGSTADHTGSVVYSGMDADAFGDTGSPNYALKELALELALPFQRSPASCAPNCSAPGGGGSGSGLGASGNPTFAQCAIAAGPKSWVRGTVPYALKLSLVKGIRAEIRTTSGKLVGSRVQPRPSGTLKLRLNTKRLPTNRVSVLNLLVYVNEAKACTLPTKVKVDNTAPRLLSKSVRRQGSQWNVTGRPSESVTFSVWSHGRLLRAVYLPRARRVSLLLPQTRVPSAIVLRDRAGNTKFVSLPR